jgi:nitrous oxidase accessory protein NosD
MKPLIFALLTLAAPAAADVEVRFVEGAPVDRFSFEVGAGCPLGASVLSLDLTGSAGRLIFDTAGAGAGVQVYQPFVLVEGAEQVAEAPDLRDGDRGLTLELSELSRTLVFTTDLDDTIGAAETLVSGSEIAGATVSITLEDVTYSGVFDAQARARVTILACLS